MSCKVYTGDASLRKPVRIVCSNFNTDLSTSMILRMGFWTRNPQTDVSLAIPVELSNYRMDNDRNRNYDIIEGAIRVIPTSTTPIADTGNFVGSST